jgi:hypothetical protein
MRENDNGVSELGAVPINGAVPGTLDAALYALNEPQAFVDLWIVREDGRTADWLGDP